MLNVSYIWKVISIILFHDPILRDFSVFHIMSLFICYIVITNCRASFWVGLFPKDVTFILNCMKVSHLAQRLKVGLAHIQHTIVNFILL